MSFKHEVVLTGSHVFNIKNIIPRQTKLTSTFSSGTTTTYNVECFGAVKWACRQNSAQFKEHCETTADFQYFAYRAISKLPSDSTEVGSILFINEYNRKQNKYYVSLELHPKTLELHPKTLELHPKTQVETEETI